METVAARKLYISKKALDAIIGFEVGAESPGDTKYYIKKLSRPSWPGLDSGATIGIGYDLGYHSAEEIRADWAYLLPAEDINELVKLAGLKGASVGGKMTGRVKNIVVPYEAAYQVFQNKTLPKYAAQACSAYPGLQDLFPDAIGAIVSLVFNRGNLLEDKAGDKNQRRKEMAAIRPLVPMKDYAGIAQQIRNMTRLWDGIPNYPGAQEDRAGGLIKRRLDEANLVDHSVHQYSLSELVQVNF